MTAFLTLFTPLVLHGLSVKKGPTPHLDGRIVGGTKTQIEDFPYQLSLQYRGSHICGASIISQKYALTAAHCTEGNSPNVLSLRAGSSYYNRGGQVLKISKIHQHPKFVYSTVDYDISILETSTSFNLNNSTIKCIGLTVNEVREGSTALVSGWGTTEENGSDLPMQLQMVQLPIISRHNCEKAYEGFHSITNRMICAGYFGHGGKDSCQGDSGGPLVVNGRLSGIVSWGYGCARSEYPGVYTNLGNRALRQFVRSVTGL